MYLNKIASQLLSYLPNLYILIPRGPCPFYDFFFPKKSRPALPKSTTPPLPLHLFIHIQTIRILIPTPLLPFIIPFLTTLRVRAHTRIILRRTRILARLRYTLLRIRRAFLRFLGRVQFKGAAGLEIFLQVVACDGRGCDAAYASALFVAGAGWAVR